MGFSPHWIMEFQRAWEAVTAGKGLCLLKRKPRKSDLLECGGKSAGSTTTKKHEQRPREEGKSAEFSVFGPLFDNGNKALGSQGRRGPLRSCPKSTTPPAYKTNSDKRSGETLGRNHLPIGRKKAELKRLRVEP